MDLPEQLLRKHSCATGKSCAPILLSGQKPTPLKRRPQCHSGPASAHGFSFLELALAIVVISFLFVIGMSRLWAWQVEAERVAMENVLGAVRSALGMKVASYLAKDEAEGIRELVGANPMDVLVEPPKNYLGVRRGDAADIAGGEWYFDRDAQALVYRVQHAEYFTGRNGEARFRIEAVHEDGRKAGAIQGLRLVAVEPYRWRRAGEEDR